MHGTQDILSVSRAKKHYLYLKRKKATDAKTKLATRGLQVASCAGGNGSHAIMRASGAAQADKRLALAAAAAADEGRAQYSADQPKEGDLMSSSSSGSEVKNLR